MAGKNKIPAKYQKDYPHRVVDWRWRQATLVPKVQTDDEYVLLAQRFHDALSKQLSADHGELYDQFPDLYVAWDIYADSGSYRQAELEARILAQEDFRQIANKMCLSTDIVAIYEAVFYNVLDRIDSASYILHFALNTEYPDSLRYDTGMWRFFGYHFGPEFLDYLIYRVPRGDSSKTNMDELLLKSVRHRLAVMTSTADYKNQGDFLKLFDLYVRRMEAAGAGSMNNEMMEKLHSVLSNLSWSKASRSKVSDNGTISDYVGKSNSPADSKDG